MFPIRDHNPSGRMPFVTWSLIFFNVVIFLNYWPGGTDSSIHEVFAQHAMIPARLNAGDGYVTLLSSMFLHGGWMHLAGNMLFLYIFGDNLEDEMGHAGFALFYVATGVVAGLAQYHTAPESMVPTVGASGAIAGVMGGYLLLFPRARVDVLVIVVIIFQVFTVPAWAMLIFWFGLQLFHGMGADASMGGVAYWAHAGGFAAGLVLTLPVWLRLGGPAFWARHHGRPPHPEAEYSVGRTRIPHTDGRRRRKMPRIGRRR